MVLRTGLAPEALLEFVKGLESRAGRVESFRNAPRPLDIDILFYVDDGGEHVVMESERLTIPHPRMHERGFVLVPLAEIAGDARHPVLGRTVGELRASLRLREVYERLLGAYGQQGWWPGDTPFEVMVGAVLTQNTAWTNVEKAIAALREADALNPPALRTRPLDELAALIRPSGYFNAKARKLRALGEYLGEHGDDVEALFSSRPMDELREELRGLHGVGPETADSMLLYAGNLPSFVIDAYTIRILTRLGILNVDSKPSYADAQAMFHEALPRDAALFNEYHALFVAHGKDVCRARRPLCGECVLAAECEFGLSPPQQAAGEF